ncbi:MAG: hypothetical protein IT427_13280 [Pirellulales bacterium]|nr:hypothetical protein [Pirellulales bacterium]
MRYTRDADILIATDESNVDAVLKAMIDAGFQPKKLPPILQIDDQQLIQLKFVPPDGIAPFQLDLFFAGSEYQKAALLRAATQQIATLDYPVKVLRPDDLILLKLCAGRMIDRADAAMLLRENREDMDFNYMTKWVKHFKLQKDFSEIWAEAFPDEQIPAEFSSSFSIAIADQLPTYFAYTLRASAISLVPPIIARPSGNSVMV